MYIHGAERGLKASAPLICAMARLSQVVQTILLLVAYVAAGMLFAALLLGGSLQLRQGSRSAEPLEALEIRALAKAFVHNATTELQSKLAEEMEALKRERLRVVDIATALSADLQKTQQLLPQLHSLRDDFVAKEAALSSEMAGVTVAKASGKDFDQQSFLQRLVAAENHLQRLGDYLEDIGKDAKDSVELQDEVRQVQTHR
eukprot:scaffold388_cov244-Pinguiococcus_pyrenoidosus.AAC.6